MLNSKILGLRTATALIAVFVAQAAHAQTDPGQVAPAPSKLPSATVGATAANAPASDDALPGATPPSGQTLAPAAAAGSQDMAGDIIVTANKREQRLNDVGLTISVLGANELTNQKVSSLADIAHLVPGLTFANSANNTPVYTLRGVGFYETSIGAYPTVSIYIDQAPLPFPVMTRHSAFDLERIEVLKGPQGTLFGSNATGGAINYITAKPTSVWTGGINASYGRFNEVDTEGFVSGPITPNLLFRVSGRLERADDWQQSYTRSDTLGKTRNYMGRLILDFKPTDTISVELNVNGWKDKSDTQAPQYIGLQPGNPVVPAVLLNAQFAPNNARAADWTPGLPFGDNSMFQAALRADWNFVNNITLTSLTNLVRYNQRQGDDGDGLPASALDLPLDAGHIHTFTQELRLSNGGARGFRWVVGGNYENSQTYQVADLNYSASSASATYATVGYPIATAHYYTDQNIRNLAAFANAEYDISSAITLRAGGRYTDSKDVGLSCNSVLNNNPTDVGPFLFNYVLGGAYGTYKPGQCFVINNQGVAIGGVAAGAPGAFAETLHEHNFSWRTGVDWKVTSGILLYANAAKGYKAGSFPFVSGSVFSSYLPVKQESVLSFEAGVKASLFDRRLQLNGAGFYYDYRNKQIRSKLKDPSFGILDVLQNIPKSTIKGVEIEATANVGGGLTINLSGTYIDAKIDQFTGINGSGLAGDFAGQPVPFTPKFTVNFGPQYRVPLNDRMALTTGVQINYQSKTTAVIGGDVNPPNAIPQGLPLSRIDGYALVDARLGVSIDNDRINIFVYGKNIFNKYYWTNVVTTADTVGRYAGRPATYGISAGYKF